MSDPVKFMGFEVVDECPCGAKVEPFDRQELVLDYKTEKWYRMCESCINRGCEFRDPGPEPVAA